MGRFEGKVAIVTGAAGGIGEAYARALAADGASVVVADLNEQGKGVADDIGGLYVQTDVSDPASAERLAARTTEHFGGIDFLVNNAAIFGDMKLDFLFTVDWDYYKTFMSVNMDGALLCARACHRSMRERGGGCSPVVVVTGAAPVEMFGAVVVPNPGWRSGMGSSLRTGLAALPPGCPAVVVALVDQPLVTSEAVRRLIEAYEKGASVVVATYGGRPRNPVLIAGRHFAMVAESAVGDVGAREFLRAHPALVTDVACDDVAAPDDIDTPEDLAALSRRGLISGAEGVNRQG